MVLNTDLCVMFTSLEKKHNAQRFKLILMTLIVRRLLKHYATHWRTVLEPDQTANMRMQVWIYTSRKCLRVGFRKATFILHIWIVKMGQTTWNVISLITQTSVLVNRLIR